MALEGHRIGGEVGVGSHYQVSVSLDKDAPSGLICTPAYDCRPLIPRVALLSEMRVEVCARSCRALKTSCLKTSCLKTRKDFSHAIHG
jgi:hypothetical protein